MRNDKEKVTGSEEMVTISRAEYENMRGQIQWLMEQLRLSRQKRFGASSERTSEEVMEQLSQLFNEAEVYVDQAAEEDDGDFVIDDILPLDDGGFLTGGASPSDAAVSQAAEVLPNQNTAESIFAKISICNLYRAGKLLQVY